ncbi:MAG: stage II sporulation protein P [Clostridia bacterium]|nr:stage II sporulation protein P [Clostridia bacterium]MBQ6703238.1 stage II sporulation protein P [Clostridia bacterium]
MQKKRRKTQRISLAPLMLFIVCAAVCSLRMGAYYDGSASLGHLLLSLQFPFLHTVPLHYYQPEQEQAPDALPPDISIELIPSAPDIDLGGNEPRILIYHTHATEAYFKTKDSTYEDSSKWRTLENDKNMIAVGEKLADTLRSYGIAVLHDTTNHEPPKLATAYSRSVVTMEEYKEKYPSITMFIDVHRDAYGNDPKEIADYVTIDGKEYARIMFVVGTGKGATGTGYSEMPDFEANYALAKRITEYVAAIDQGLVREIRVKSGRYNQHVSDQCLLVEVGHNANTLEQALNSTDFLAEAIANCGGLSPHQLSLSP